MINPFKEVSEFCDLSIDEKVKLPIAIVGAGGIVDGAHLPAYKKANLTVVGIFDTDPAKAKDGRVGRNEQGRNRRPGPCERVAASRQETARRHLPTGFRNRCLLQRPGCKILFSPCRHYFLNRKPRRALPCPSASQPVWLFHLPRKLIA